MDNLKQMIETFQRKDSEDYETFRYGTNRNDDLLISSILHFDNKNTYTIKDVNLISNLLMTNTISIDDAKKLGLGASSSVNEIVEFLTKDKNSVIATEIKIKLARFYKATNDILASVLLQNIDLLTKNDTTLTNKFNSYLYSVIEEGKDKQYLQKSLEKIVQFIEEIKVKDSITYEKYKAVLNTTTESLVTDLDASTWAVSQDDFNVGLITISPKAVSFKNADELKQFVYENLTKDAKNSFKENKFEIFENCQNVLSAIQNNIDLVLTENDKNFINTISDADKKKELISLLTTCVIVNHLVENNIIEDNNILSSNLRLHVQNSINHLYSSSLSDIEIKEFDQIFDISSSVADSLNVKKTRVIDQEVLNDDDIIIEEDEIEPKIIPAKDYINKFMNETTKIAMNLKGRYEIYLEILKKVNDKANFAKLKQEEKAIINKFIDKFKNKRSISKNADFVDALVIDEKGKTTIDFAKLNQETSKELVITMIDELKDEKDAYSSFLEDLQKNKTLRNKLTLTILSGGTKKEFIDNCSKIIEENISSQSIIRDSINKVLGEIYTITAVQSAFIKTNIPYSLAKPNYIQEIIIDDSKNSEPKYPNLYESLLASYNTNATKGQYKLDKKFIKNVFIAELNKADATIDSPEIKKILQEMVKKYDDEKITKEERAEIKKNLKLIYSKDTKNTKYLPTLLKKVSAKNSKDELIDLIASKTNTNADEFKKDLENVNIDNKEIVKNKYLSKLTKKEDKDIFIKKYDKLFTKTAKKSNKNSLNERFEQTVCMYINNFKITSQDSYALLTDCKTIQALVKNLKAKSSQEEIDDTITKINKLLEESFSANKMLIDIKLAFKDELKNTLKAFEEAKNANKTPKVSNIDDEEKV